MKNGAAATTEAVYVVPGEVSGEAITRSLQALLPTRHHAIARHRFTVLDTFDERVRRAGACLTRGGDGNATVAWQTRGSGRQLKVRLKQPASFAWDFPAGPLQQTLASVIGPRRLLEQADAEEHGSLLEVLDDVGKTVARLRIASAQARLPSPSAAWRRLPTMVTLTALRGYEGTYSRLVPVVESRPGLQRCPEGSLDVMLAGVGAPRRGDVSSPRVDLASTVRADIGARRIHLALLAVLEANEPGLRANLDSEFLHDFRVTVRRTRSLLGQIRRVFPTRHVEHFSTEFSWVGRLTGPPRDLDVLVLSLRERGADFSAADMQVLRDFFTQAQQQEHDRLIESLDSDRYQQLISDWKAFLHRRTATRVDAENAGSRLATVVAGRAWQLSQRIANTARSIDRQTSPARLHEARIDAKKLRYLIDVTPAFYDPADLECILGALKKLQRVLGDFNDAAAQEKRLLDYGRMLGAAGGPPDALLALGRLAEQSHQRRERLRHEVVEKLERFQARETRMACRRAFKQSASEERPR
jgi:CHAD domain-containing protein